MNLQDLLTFNLDDFHFLRPEFLWIFIPLVFIFIIMIFHGRKAGKWQKKISPHLRNYVIINRKKKIWPKLLFLVTFSTVILSIAGPAWELVEKPGTKTKATLYVLLDLSSSMLAEDVQANRLERAKFKVKDLLNANPKTNVALIAYAGTPHLVVPSTSDYRIINEYLNALKPSIMPALGTRLDYALAYVDSLIEGEIPLSVVVITDSPVEKDYYSIKKFVDKERVQLFYMPMASLSGAPVPKLFRRGYERDQNGEIISSLDKQTVDKIAGIDKVEHVQMVLDDSEVKLIAEKVKNQIEFIEDEEKKEEEWQDSGMILLLPIGLMILLWFRKGFTVFASIGLLFSLSACKSDINTVKFNDLWYSKDYQGQMLSKKGDYETAAETYETEIRKGIAYYKTGNYQAAIEAFRSDSSAMGAYNLGLAYNKNGNYRAALAAFELAIQKDPNLKQARSNSQQIQSILEQIDPDKVNKNELGRRNPDGGIQATDRDELSGETEAKQLPKDMDNRKTDEVITNIRMGKESEELFDEFETRKQMEQNNAGQMLVRKISADPSTFLKLKFAYQKRKYFKNHKEEIIKW